MILNATRTSHTNYAQHWHEFQSVVRQFNTPKKLDHWQAGEPTKDTNSFRGKGNGEKKTGNIKVKKQQKTTHARKILVLKIWDFFTDKLLL